MGFEPETSAIPVRCSTNWAMKPHIGSEVNLLSSHLPVRSEMMWSIVGRALHWYRGGLGFKSRWSSNFCRLLLSNCLNWKIYCDDHSSLSSTTTVHIWIISYKLHIISLLTGRYELNKLTSLPMCGFIAQLVEHCTGIVEVTGSNPLEVLIFQASSFQLLKLKNFTAMIILHFQSLYSRLLITWTLTYSNLTLL